MVKTRYKILGSIIVAVVIFGGSLTSSYFNAAWKAGLLLNPDRTYMIVEQLSPDTNGLIKTYILTKNTDSRYGFTKWLLDENSSKIYSDWKVIKADWTVQFSPDDVKYISDRKVGRANVTILEDETNVRIFRTTNYTKGSLVEEWKLPYDSASSTKYSVTFTPKPGFENNYYKLTQTFSATNISKNYDFWNNHTLIVSDFQMSWFNEKEKINKVSATSGKVSVEFNPQFGRFELDPIIRIGPVAIEYYLVRDDLAGRSYSSDCHKSLECDIPINVSINQNLVLNVSDFTNRVQIAKGIAPNNIYFEVLYNKTVQDRLYVNTTSVCSTKKELNGTTHTDCNYTDNYVPINRTVLDWKQISGTVNIVANRTYSINLKVFKSPNLGQNYVDVFPSIKGIEIPL